MDSEDFIYRISVGNSQNFEILNKNKICSEIRRDIYNFLISRKNEEDFFDVDKLDKECLEIIFGEIEKAGWKYKLSYGDTGLFIFKENVPRNCW